MRDMPEFQQYPMNRPIPSDELLLYVGIHSGRQGVAPHYHPFAELTFVRSGGGYKTVNGRTHRMKPGTVCLYLPNHVHGSVHDVERPPEVYCCMFDFGLVAGTSLDSACIDLLHRIGSTLPSHIHLEGEAYDRMESVLDQLHDEYHKPAHTLGRNGLLRGKLTEALLLFLREAASGHHSTDRVDTLNKTASVLWPALEYVHVHYTEPLTLQNVASALHVSAPVVSRTFREHTGLSFLQYLHRLRVESAAHMLVASELPVADITFAVGFESFRTFARVFRALKGAPPSAYRSAGRDA